jgi:hypothetical protein
MQAQDGSIMEISRGPHDSGRYTGLYVYLNASSVPPPYIDPALQ